MHFIGKVKVQFKKSVLEPQGKAIELSLHENHVSGIQQIRVGKWIEIALEEESLEAAKTKVEEIAEKMLYNPVMETVDITVEEA